MSWTLPGTRTGTRSAASSDSEALGIVEDFDAGRLAEPHADDAVVARSRERGDELRAAHGGRPELLVDGAPQDDVVLLRERAQALDLLVEAPER